MKKELINYLEQFQALINTNFKGQKEIISIELFSGIKPASYYVPKIFHTDIQLHPAWFVEIWINEICIWRKSQTNETNENLQQYENILIKQIIREIIFHGLFSSWEGITRTTNQSYEKEN